MKKKWEVDKEGCKSKYTHIDNFFGGWCGIMEQRIAIDIQVIEFALWQ